MRKLPIITDHAEVTPTTSTALHIQKFGRGCRPVKWYNRPMGQYYTVGGSLMCAITLIIVLIAMLTVWTS